MSERTFEASRFLTALNGRDYLEVKWRLLWLRTEHPDAEVRTELAEHREGFALFRAEVRLVEGGVATGWGSETAADFGDYVEKAETKALGRALGFGTQFCEDYSYGAEGGRVVDTPVARRDEEPARGGRSLATEPQVKAMYAIGRDGGLAAEDVEGRSREGYGKAPEELTRAEASEFIDALRRDVGEAASRPASRRGHAEERSGRGRVPR